MAEIVGYKLVDSNGAEFGSWGGVWGQVPGIPNPLILPSGLNHVHCASVGVSYADIDKKTYKLVEWLMDSPPPEPAVLEPYQFFSMLELSGKKTALNNFIDSLPAPANVIARNKLEHTKVFERNNDLVLQAQQALGLSDQELDALWAQAAAIQ